jgi:hypothetical protein
LDEDLTRINFNLFNEGSEDIYPSVTLCFTNPYIEGRLEKYGINLTVQKYNQFLKGTFWTKEIASVDYDNVTFDIKDYLVGYDILYDKKESISYTNWQEIQNNKIGWKLPYVTVSDPDMKCFSVDIPNENTGLIKSFNMRLKTNIFVNNTRPSKLVYSPTDVQASEGFLVLISYPGQLLGGKYKAKKDWQARKTNDSEYYSMVFLVQNIEVVHHRNKRRRRCSERPFDSDILTTQKIADMAGCRAPFMKIKTNLSTKENGEPYFNITFVYVDSKYREIRGVKSFSLISLFGNIGGYVGIFIGYALFNLPDLFTKIKNAVNGDEEKTSDEITNEKENNLIEHMLTNTK